MNRLIVLRGPSGSGKSTTAEKLRERMGEKVALIGQDYLRRYILKEKEVPHSDSADLTGSMVGFALDRGYDVIVEGIFNAGTYDEMFRRIREEHACLQHFFYFDIALEETLRRHETKSTAHEFGEKEMRVWYKEKDFLICATETVISESMSQEEVIEFILEEIK